MRALPAPVLPWLAALFGFIILAVFAAVYDRFPTDLWLMHRFQDIESPTFARTLNWAADIVTGWHRLVVVAAGVVCLLLARRWLGAVLLLVSPSAGLLGIAVKEIVGRPRPNPDLVSFTTGSQSLAFPSGHAVSAIVIYGLLFYLITVFVSQPALRLLGQAVCLWVILFTGMERVYIGVHWPSDVLGGYYLGGLVLGALIALHRRLRPAPEAVTGNSRPRY